MKILPRENSLATPFNKQLFLKLNIKYKRTIRDCKLAPIVLFTVVLCVMVQAQVGKKCPDMRQNERKIIY